MCYKIISYIYISHSAFNLGWNNGNRKRILLDQSSLKESLKSIHFLTLFARSSVDSKQGTFTKPIKLTTAEVPCFESTEDRAQDCFKNKLAFVFGWNWTQFSIVWTQSRSSPESLAINPNWFNEIYRTVLYKNYVFLFNGWNLVQSSTVLSELKADRHLNHWQLTRIDSMKWGARSSTLPLSHPISYFIWPCRFINYYWM